MKFIFSSSVALTVAMTIANSSIAQATTITSDFSWVSPTFVFSDTTTLSDGTVVTLETQTVPFIRLDSNPTIAGWNQFGTSNDGILTLSFDRVISELRFLTSDIDPSLNESLSNFSVVPTAVDGNYQLSGGVVRSIVENGSGNLFWDSLNNTSISFQFNRSFNSGLNFIEFEIDTPDIQPVPEPLNNLSLLTVIGFGALFKKKPRLGRLIVKKPL